ncbi:hypothetical protein AHF37_00105 [Paragonimus kellicotti]|nr:hypothetical protein AHF37_00105 [Paragonimus kellicotti]
MKVTLRNHIPLLLLTNTRAPLCNLIVIKSPSIEHVPVTEQNIVDAGTKASATVCVCAHDPTISNRYAEFLRFHSPNRQVYNGDFNRLQTDPLGCHFVARNRMLCEVSSSPVLTTPNALGQPTEKAGQVNTDLSASFSLNKMPQRLCAFYDTSSTNVHLVALPLCGGQTDTCMNSITPLTHCGAPSFVNPLQTNSHFVHSVMESNQESLLLFFCN